MHLSLTVQQINGNMSNVRLVRSDNEKIARAVTGLESGAEHFTMGSAEIVDDMIKKQAAAKFNEKVDEYQEKLDAHAKKIKIQHGAVADKPKKKTKRERKPNELKRTLIEVIADAMENYLGEEVTVRNIEKYIDFSIDERDFTINLVEHRPTKEKKK